MTHSIEYAMSDMQRAQAEFFKAVNVEEISATRYRDALIKMAIAHEAAIDTLITEGGGDGKVFARFSSMEDTIEEAFADAIQAEELNEALEEADRAMGYSLGDRRYTDMREAAE